MQTLSEVKDQVSGLVQQAYDIGRNEGLTANPNMPNPGEPTEPSEKIYSEADLQAKVKEAMVSKDAELAGFKSEVAQLVQQLKETDLKEDAAVAGLESLIAPRQEEPTPEEPKVEEPAPEQPATEEPQA